MRTRFKGADAGAGDLVGAGPFVEGWAVYDRARDERTRAFGGPEVKMQQLKMRGALLIKSRSSTISVHTAGAMTEQEAMEPDDAARLSRRRRGRGQWRRAPVSRSTQLSTYFVGANSSTTTCARRRSGRRRRGRSSI
jgi:hypothetical protein